MAKLQAKDAIDNGGVGRAAKGAIPITSTTKMEALNGLFIFVEFCDYWMGGNVK